MDKYDELLARLDEAAGRIFGPGVFADAAAAIRELEAKLEAERKAREITADRAAENFSAAVEAGDRAEAAEQRLREEVAHLSQYSDNQFLAKVEAMERATEAEVKLRGVEAAKVTCQKDGVMFGKYCWFSHETITGCEAALIPTKHKQYYEWFLAALSPERTVAVPKNCRDNGWHPTCDRCAVADYEHCRYTTAAPASPLAPGRDRAAETCKHDRKIIRGNDYGSDLAWCDDCGEITWASDADWPDPITRKYSERVDWFKKRVIAFGCCKEAKPVDKWNDGKRCEIWCNHTYCPVSLKPAEISRLKGEGSAP